MSKLFENAQDQESSQAPSSELPVNAETGLLDWTQGLGNQGMLERLGMTGTAGLDGPLPSVSRPDFLCYGAGARATELQVEDGLGAIVGLTDLWRLPNPGGTMRLAMAPGRCEPVVELLWCEAWGPRPHKQDVSDNEPIAAKMAVGFLRRQPAWGVLSAQERGDLEVLVGGEENSLSKAVRTQLEVMLDERGFDDGDIIGQVSRLRGFLVRMDMLPFASDEPGAVQEPALSSLSGPERVDKFQFEGVEQPAMIWTLVLENGHSVEVVAPVTEDPAPTRVLNAVAAYTRMPERNQMLVERLIFNPVVATARAAENEEIDAKNLPIFMETGAEGDIFIYPIHVKPPSQTMYGDTLMHETGHVWSMRRWGDDETSEEWRPWREAIEEDGVTVSGYAKEGVHDDFAETFDAYTSTWGRPENEEYRMLVPARFAILDRQLAPEMNDAR
ncbi:MAG: hypothetical protein H6741_16060 [Alphaproteobacteria bacterium]|nr:hypothetical protein [Alphaproteobacteria bacterium]MCB9794229.1 hypothetical protein [Alphaproteobacteria bacterium]